MNDMYKNNKRGGIGILRKEMKEMFNDMRNSGNRDNALNNPIRKEIKQIYGSLSVNTNSGWETKVCVISWNGGTDKLDIRAWNSDMTKCGKGISLSNDEAFKLYQILGNIYGYRKCN